MIDIMKKFLYFTVFLLLALCDVKAQTVQLQQLKDTKWHMKEPNNTNVDTYFSFSDKVLTNVSEVHYPDTKYGKGLNRKYVNRYSYYLADNIPDCFDKNKVGQTECGAYIVQELDGMPFCFQILHFSSSELKLKNMQGQTFVFEKQ